MSDDELARAREMFLSHWGIVGAQWGINRTMAQIHALLIISPKALTTDDIMEQLAISRGNAHKNLKDLINWGLIQQVIKRGDRKDYYEAEKDVMKMLQTVIRERKKRELDPALAVVSDCADISAGLKGEEAELFNKQMNDIKDLLSTGSTVLNKFTESEKNTMLMLMLKILS